jgi:DNA repair protein RadA/Sms
MGGAGLQAIPNPSAFFLKERPTDEPGSVVVSTIKGSRPLLAEIQALVSSTLFVGSPRRMTIGLDHFRTSMLLAVVEKKLGFGFGGEDIYLNVAGGVTIDEPAADLAVVLAVVSSLKNRPIPSQTAVFGEVGLSGEVRSVGQPLARIKEAASLGFERVVVPQGNLVQLEKEETPRLEVLAVRDVRQAFKLMF